MRLLPSSPLATAAAVVRPHLAAVLQTAIAAVAAWLLADLLLPTNQPTFASIAAIICLGAAYGRRRRNALELLGGVTLGIAVASVLVFLIGTGPFQIGALVILAMTVALLFRGSELLVNEAAISAILIAAFAPEGSSFSADRILEGLIGGGVGLRGRLAAAAARPGRDGRPGRADAVRQARADARARRRRARGRRPGPRPDAALSAARGTDDDVDQLEQTLSAAVETARFSPQRRGGLHLVGRYEATMPEDDSAVRDTRVLARYAARQVRHGEPAPGTAGAVRELADAVWILAAHYENPERGSDLEAVALRAARTAEDIHDREPSLLTTQIVGQVRSSAVDLVRAAEQLGGARAEGPPSWDLPTEELLAV